jgi:gamma-glutamylcyclotransferase
LNDVAGILYLAYGSNMWPRRIELRLGACHVAGVVSLEGYALRFHKRGRDGSGKCDAFHTGNPTDTLHGVVYSLTRPQTDLLDEFEGPGYTSHNVTVRARSGMLAAYAYVARPEHVDTNLQPFGWYKSIVMAGARAHALPAHYIESIAAVCSLPDPDTNRDSHHLAMLDGHLTGETNS